MLTNGIILAIMGCSTLKPLGIYFRPFANNGHDTKYHKLCIEHNRESPCHKFQNKGIFTLYSYNFCTSTPVMKFGVIHIHYHDEISPKPTQWPELYVKWEV
jgi:hypothetical protein